MTVSAVSEVRDRVRAFIRERFMDGDPERELADDTELLALGILDSLNMALLMAFISDDLGVRVPLAQMTAQNFGSVSAIVTLITGLPGGQPASDA